MISRYTREEMGRIWSPESRFEFMKQVEVVVAQVQGTMNIIPKVAAAAISRKARFQIQRIEEIEKTTKHDVIAFVSNLAENVGKKYGRYIHFAMTSSDILDTALSLQVRAAGKELNKSLHKLDKALIQQVQRHETTLCAGRTHGVHAEPTSFGLKLAGHLMELRRNQVRLTHSLKDMEIGKLSGAVGTYSAQSVQVERKVCQKFKAHTRDHCHPSDPQRSPCPLASQSFHDRWGIGKTRCGVQTFTANRSGGGHRGFYQRAKRFQCHAS